MRRPLTSSTRPRRSRVALAASIAGFVVVSSVGAFFAAAAVVGLPACSSSDAGGFTPITGIVVLSDTVTAGHGCGTQAGQIYKYAAVVALPGIDAGPEQFIAAEVSDCFANATFVNLCASSTGSTSYDVYVYAFTADQWSSVSGAVTGALGSKPSYCTFDAGRAPDAATLDPAAIKATLDGLAALATSCTATQQQNVPVIASCSVLAPTRP